MMRQLYYNKNNVNSIANNVHNDAKTCDLSLPETIPGELMKVLSFSAWS